MSDSAATGSSPMWTSTGTTYRFGPDGSLEAPGVASADINNLVINGVAIGKVELKHDTNGVSQFADVNGTVNVSTLNQNGYGAGEFVSVAINDSGRVVATYSNGERHGAGGDGSIQRHQPAQAAGWRCVFSELGVG